MYSMCPPKSSLVASPDRAVGFINCEEYTDCTLIPNNSRSLPATFIGRARIVVHWGVGHRHAPSQRGPFFPASCFDDYFGPTSRPRRYLFTPPRCMVGLELCCTRPACYTRSSRCGHREVGGVAPLQPWGLTAQKYTGLVSRPPPAGATTRTVG